MASIPEVSESTAGECPVAGAEKRPFQKLISFPRRWPEPQRIAGEAQDYLCLLEREEVLDSDALGLRAAAVSSAIACTGTYTHTLAELEHGAKVAWRNSARCIGRLYWEKLAVRDLRHLDNAADVF